MMGLHQYFSVPRKKLVWRKKMAIKAGLLCSKAKSERCAFKMREKALCYKAWAGEIA